MKTEVCLKEAKEAALRAGSLLSGNIDTSREISFKGAIDLVTDFDNKSQKIIFDHLAGLFPDHDFLAEEGLSREKGSDFRWIIDPLDGTTNYAHNFPIFTVSIALERKKEFVLGVVYDPLRREMFEAVRGEGAFLNGKRIQVSSIDDLGRSLLATGFPYDAWESEVNNLDHFSNFLLRSQDIRRCGSAALDLCYVACGRLDGFWELKLKPWDVAAGSLIVGEAGGRISDFEGQDFDIFGAECLASNGLIHQQMIDVLRLGKRPERPTETEGRG